MGMKKAATSQEKRGRNEPGNDEKNRISEGEKRQGQAKNKDFRRLRGQKLQRGEGGRQTHNYSL